MKNLITKLLIITAMLGLVQPTTALAAAPPDPEVQGGTAILLDGTTGEILYQKNMDEPREPASTTKVMTALLALENLDLDKVVTIDAETPFIGGSRIYLVEGEEITVRELLFALMVESANDAGDALAKEVAGSVENFAIMMNDRARQLGARNTNFVNPHGLHEEGHTTTSYDLAVIAREAMKNETFRELVSTYNHNIEATNKQEKRYLYNTNRLLYDEKTQVTVNGVNRGCKYEGILGVKTGYTPQAGGTLVAAAERDGTYLIAVVMDSTDKFRFQDCISMMDWGFTNYKTAIGMGSGAPLGTIDVKKGAVGSVAVELSGNIMKTIPADMDYADLRAETELKEFLTAPVEEGTVAGVVRLFQGSEFVAEYDVVVSAAVDKGGILSNFGVEDQTAKKIWFTVALIIFALMALLTGYVLFKRHQIKMKKMRKQQRRERQMHKDAGRRSVPAANSYAFVNKGLVPSGAGADFSVGERSRNNVTSFEQKPRRDVDIRRKDYAMRGGSRQYVYRYSVR